jgi:hypothetical protein
MATTTGPSANVTATRKPYDASKPILLAVPFFSQRDSATGHGDWLCFSSTSAMAAEFLKPGCLTGSGQPDDRYLALVQRFGETTNAQAQAAALERLGILATFHTDGRIEQLIVQLRLGFPIPVGWDPATRQVILHDPYGEANLVGDGYETTAIGSGEGQRYSERNGGAEPPP